MTNPCTLWLDREPEDAAEEFWAGHLASCEHCRREQALDELLARQRIRVADGFSGNVMRAIAGRSRAWGVGAVAASVALLVAAGWLLGTSSGVGLGAGLLGLFADAMTVGWGWLGASWAGVRIAVRTGVDARALAGLAMMLTALGILTWRLVRRRTAIARQRSR